MMSPYKKQQYLPINAKLFLTSGIRRVLLILGLILFLWMAIFWASILP